jgi:2-keto-3-deoxy-6-phosphogluconate aldolase
MAKHTRINVINTCFEQRLILTCSSKSQEILRKCLTSCADGGAKLMEHAVNSHSTLEAFEQLSQYTKQDEPEVLLGASITTVEMASAVIQAGACFVCSEYFDETIARLCNQVKICYIPKCSSFEELKTAEELGAEFIKIKGNSAFFSSSSLKSLVKKKLPTNIICEGNYNEINHLISPYLQEGVFGFCLKLDDNIWKEKGNNEIETFIKSIENNLWKIKEANGEKLFSGIEHVGIYPENDQQAADMIEWYQQIFGFDKFDGDSYYFAASSGPGRIEILNQPEATKAHMAIKVNHMDLACEVLRAKGIEFEPMKDFGRIKAVFLKQPDPGKYKIHLLYKAI